MELKTWPLKLGIVTLIVTIFPWSYWVYGLGKIVVCAIASYYAYRNHSSGKKQTKTFWYFLAVAIIFNPLLPLHLFFSVLWIIVDIAVAAFFWSYLKELNHNTKNISSIQSKEVIKTSKSMKDYKSPITAQVQSHMEFLGYKTEQMEDDKADTFLASSESRSNINVRVMEDLVLITARYSTAIKSKSESIEFFKVLNKVNSEAIVSRWYSQIKDDGQLVLVIEAYQYGYEKIPYGKLVDRFEADIRGYMSRFVELEDKLAEAKT
jgi:hypothetical protein